MKTFLSLSFCIFLSFTISAQEKYKLSGHVKDAESGEELIGATVAVESLNIGVSANMYGFYALSLPKGTYQLSYSFIG